MMADTVMNDKRTTDEKIAEMLAAAEKATPGPWSRVNGEDNALFQTAGLLLNTSTNNLDYLAAVDPQTITALLTELQHRRESDEAYRLREIIDNARQAFAETYDDDEARCRAMAAHLSEVDAILAASPSSPASGVRVKVKPLEWHGPDFEDEYWAASLDLKYVIHPPNERGVRWLGGVGGYFRLVDEAKSVAEKHNEARILSALGEHP